MSVLDITAPSPLTPVWDELITGLTMGVVIADERGQVHATNDIAADLMRLDKSDLLTGNRPDGWQVWDDTGAPLPDWADLIGQVLRADVPMSTPMMIVRHGQPTSRIWADYRAVRIQGRKRVLILLQAVQTDVAHNRGLMDTLTGLPGRVLLLDRLEQALARARTHGVLTTLVLMDVHRLAAFNAEHGFARGDELLTTLAGRLREGLADDHTVSRYGGDEFAVIAEHTGGAGEALAEHAREIANWPMRIGGARIRPGLRVSWVTSDGHASVHSVLNRAEQQLRR
ncbi:hypothetical protein GCM10027174_11010 [Salinifilum aidingensis]